MLTGSLCLSTYRTYNNLGKTAVDTGVSARQDTDLTVLENRGAITS